MSRARPSRTRTSSVSPAVVLTTWMGWWSGTAVTIAGRASATAGPTADAQASMTTGMIIGRRRWVLLTQRPTTRRTVCCSW